MQFWRTLTFIATTVCSFITHSTEMNTEDRLFSHPTSIDGRLVLGRTELLEFNSIPALSGVGFPAKIDTGADSTSIHAENIKIIPRDDMFDGLEGDTLIAAIIEEYNEVRGTELRDRDDITDIMVEFDIPHPYTGEMVSHRTPLLRIALVKARDNDGFLYRPVVVMPLTIAGLSVETEVNLADRSRFSVPALIGKTFLREHAWVDAGYDYLQLQEQARVIGRKERAFINDMPIEVSISLSNRYSAFHASNITIDEENGMVSFSTENSDQSRRHLTVPLVRMVPFSDGPRPLVYIPVQFGENAATDHIEVYLSDRSESQSQLRLGTDTLSRFFMVDISQQYLTEEGLESITARAEKEDLFVISPKERIYVEGVEVIAEPSLVIRTPVLTVTQSSEEPKSTLSFTLTDTNDDDHALSLPIASRLTAGASKRVTIEPELRFYTAEKVHRIAVQPSNDGVSRLLVSPTMLTQPLLVNTRSEELFEKTAPIEAGYVESVTIDELTFPAKLDTGADVSSLSATDINVFEKDGRSWVRFTYQNAQGIEEEFTKRLVSEMRVKPRPGEASIARPVVRMTVKMGDLEKSVDVNLRDRTSFEYSMILGRNFLNNNIVVSSDDQFIYTQALAED